MRSESEPSSQVLTWVLAIVGAIVGAILDRDVLGPVLGTGIGLLLAQVMHLRSWVRNLHRQVHLLQQQPQPQSQPTTPAPIVQPTTPSIPAAVPVQQQTTQPSQSASKRATQGPKPTPPPEWQELALPGSAVRSSPSLIDELGDKVLAWIKGGNPLARAGIVILFFGAAFLAKFAAEHSLFPIELRFIAIACGAFALLIVGWRLRERRPVYAQLLQGGGIAGLYLTVFAAMKLYQLLPAGLAFLLLVMIVLAAAVLAVGQNSLPLAFIGTAGGFLAPIFVSTGSGNHIALFSYYAVLNLGVFAIAWFRTWRVLNVLGFVFTFGITALWRFSGYERADLVSADAFLILFFLMYITVCVLNCLRQPPNLKGYVSGSLVFGLPIVAFGLHASLISHIEYALAWSVFALGAFYLALGWALLRSGKESFRLLVESFAALGVIFASLTIPLAFDAQTTAAMWAVEGAGLTWLGVRQQRKLPRAFGALLQLGAGISFLSVIDGLHPERFVLNVVFIGTTMLSLSGFASSYWLDQRRESLAAYERTSGMVYAIWAAFWWLAGGLYQIAEFLPDAQLGSSLVYVSLTSAALVFLGHRKQWKPALRIGWCLPAISALPALVYAVLISHPFAQLGALGWFALLTVQYGILRAADRHELLFAVGVPWLHAGALWLVSVLAAAELSWHASMQIGGVWRALPWGLVSAFALAVVSRRVPKPQWPIARHLHAYRFFAAVPLALASIMWIIGVNLTNAGDPVWLPYLPLLNPLDVSIAIVFVCVAAWWVALDAEQITIAEHINRSVLYAVFAGSMFLWLNAALIRALHYAAQTPLTAYGISHSTIVQAALSIFWGILGFGAMTFSARSKLRLVWMAGAVLMCVVVIKLFLVDLSNTGTVARIASFLSVGALLLITGYLAPLPPRQANQGVPSEV